MTFDLNPAVDMDPPDDYRDGEYEQPEYEWDCCPECGAWAKHDFTESSWTAKRQCMDDCLRCQTCGGWE